MALWDRMSLLSQTATGSSVSAAHTGVPSTQTTERSTCVATGRVYATHAMRPDNNERNDDVK